MTTPSNLPCIQSRSLTRDELHAEARALFGEDTRDWAFQCPQCEDVATGHEIAAALDKKPMAHTEFDRPMRMHEVLGQQCIGRVLGRQAGRGCQYAAFGLIPAPWSVEMPYHRHPTACFPLGPAPEFPPRGGHTPTCAYVAGLSSCTCADTAVQTASADGGDV